MKLQDIYPLADWQDEVTLWVEQSSSVMLRARTATGDPVELTGDDARDLAAALVAAADRIDGEDGRSSP